MDTSGALWKHSRAHPPEEILERFAMCRATESECEQIEEHLLVCEACRTLLDESDRWVALMKAAAHPAGVREPFWRRWGRAAAAGLGSMPRPAAAALCVAILATPVALSLKSAATGGDGPQSVALFAIRGDDDLRARLRAGGPVDLRIDDSDGIACTVAIVDAAGKQIWSGPLRGTHVRVPSLAKGTYWVRLFSAASGEQLKEYGLRAE